MTTIKTSQSHPLYVTWLDDGLPGKVGITMAPGKRGEALYAGGRWERDLTTDLDHLVSAHGAGLLVCLLEDHELAIIGAPALIEEAQRRMRVLRLPIPDGGVLPDPAPVHALVAHIEAAARAGVNVVVHCRGGLGRAGTIGGCYLRQRGLDADAALAKLRARHPTKCPETEAQRDFIRAFVPKASAPPDRISGALLAAAIGDAMGSPTEFLTLDAIHRTYGPAGVTGFVEWTTDGDRRFAAYTDDTQMSEAVARGLLEAHAAGRDLDGTMTTLARHFVEWSNHPQGGHRAPGNACMAGCRALERGVPWREAGGPTAGGCGSVMRAAPFALLYAADPARAEAWAVEHSRLTHRDPIALAACAALTRGLLALLGDAPLDAVLSGMVDAARAHSGPTADMIARAVDDARRGVPPTVTLDRLRGWAAHEAIAAAAYVLARHPDDARAAILEGANTPGDSDSIASIAGALVGARVGLGALPAEWVRDVERSAELRALADTIVTAAATIRAA